MQIDRETLIALAAEHAICTSADSKEFDHDGLERFAQAIAQRVEATEPPLNWLHDFAEACTEDALLGLMHKLEDLEKKRRA